MKSQWDFLMRTAKAGKLSHAYIFSGNNDYLKKETALKLIRFLYCKNSNDASCETCVSCRAIRSKLHPDVISISKDGSEIKISQILKLNSFLSLTSSQGGIKTVMIEEAERMNEEAQSAFLKLLEEPRGSTLFILLTEYQYLLLPTIRSRVQEVPFVLVHPFLSQEEDRWIKKLRALQKESMEARFSYAKEIAESSQEYQEMLKVWRIFVRDLLLKNVTEGKPLGRRIRSFLAILEDVSYALSMTNVSPSLSLERLFLTL